MHRDEIETFRSDLIQAATERDRSRSLFTNRKSVCDWVSIVSSSSMVAGSWWALRSR